MLRLLALALLVCLAGCVTAPANLSLSRPAGPGTVTSGTPKNNSAQIYLCPLEDKRGGTASLGTVGGRPFHVADLATWISQELECLGSSSVEIVAAENIPDAAQFGLRPRLLKAYVDSIGLTKTAVVVLAIEFISPGGQSETVVFRGQHAAMNWASSEEEVTNALRLALAECMGKVRPAFNQRLPLAKL